MSSEEARSQAIGMTAPEARADDQGRVLLSAEEGYSYGSGRVRGCGVVAHSRVDWRPTMVKRKRSLWGLRV